MRCFAGFRAELVINASAHPRASVTPNRFCQLGPVNKRACLQALRLLLSLPGGKRHQFGEILFPAAEEVRTCNRRRAVKYKGLVSAELARPPRLANEAGGRVCSNANDSHSRPRLLSLTAAGSTRSRSPAAPELAPGVSCQPV